MKNDILKYCLYYKGEKKCPEREKFVCTDKEYHLYWRFWCFEAEYYFGAFQNESRKMWERLGSNMFKDPQFQGAWKDPKWSKIQLGFMAYAGGLGMHDVIKNHILGELDKELEDLEIVKKFKSAIEMDKEV